MSSHKQSGTRLYKNYGARGIRVCDDWLHDFMNFYNWAINNECLMGRCCQVVVMGV